jgi:2-polyprenyl-3-methyl-5-hydroxy-6-metoxy-1,4-benzoquinol methylase
MTSSKDQNPTTNRMQSEKHFYNHLYARGWEKEDQRITEDIVPSNMLKYWELIKNHIHQLQSDNRQPLALDCGCGSGS